MAGNKNAPSVKVENQFGRHEFGPIKQASQGSFSNGAYNLTPWLVLIASTSGLVNSLATLDIASVFAPYRNLVAKPSVRRFRASPLSSRSASTLSNRIPVGSKCLSKNSASF